MFQRDVAVSATECWSAFFFANITANIILMWNVRELYLDSDKYYSKYLNGSDKIAGQIVLTALKLLSYSFVKL